MRQIKLIWDFRGQASAKTAEHHEIHLKEFLEKEDYPLKAFNASLSLGTISKASPIIP